MLTCAISFLAPGECDDFLGARIRVSSVGVPWEWPDSDPDTVCTQGWRRWPQHCMGNVHLGRCVGWSVRDERCVSVDNEKSGEAAGGET